jgi:hypothetical protein
VLAGTTVALTPSASAYPSPEHNLRCAGWAGGGYCDLANEYRNDFYNIYWSVNYTPYDTGDYRITIPCPAGEETLVQVGYQQTSGVNGSEYMKVPCVGS